MVLSLKTHKCNIVKLQERKRDFSVFYITRNDVFYYICHFFFDVKIKKLMQRRIDGSVNFTRDWADYENGFGCLGSEFWLGIFMLSFCNNAYHTS